MAVVIDRALLNQGFPGSTWGNLGLWTEAQDYPAACEALAVRLAEFARLQPGCSLLDVGFGHGDQLVIWRRRFGVGRIIGVEVDPAGVAEARRKLAPFKDARVQVGDARLLATDERFDRVLALDCAYHFAPRSAFLAQVFRLLRPGGVLALTDVAVSTGQDASRYGHLAKACGMPPENLLTQRHYEQALLDLGFSHIRFERLDEEVLSGFSRFAWRLLRCHPARVLGRGGMPILATAAMAAWLRRGQKLSYVLVRAERSSASMVAA